MSSATISPASNGMSARHNDPAMFDYTPVPAIAPVAAVFGILSLTALLALFGIAIALLALLIGLAAWRTIAISDGQYGGRWLAILGVVLSTSCFFGGIALQVRAYQTEVPAGVERVSFNYDISQPGMAYARDEDGQPRMAVPKSVKELDGKEVFIKGFMYPEQQQVGLRKFLLVKDSGDCCFGGQPVVQDIIGVRFAEESDLSAKYQEQVLVSVAGTFHIREGYTGSSLEPIYEIEATHFSRSKSSF